MIRELLSQHEMLALFDRDRSTWDDIDSYPDTVTCRRLLRFADWAARFPRHYQAAKICYEAPELSFREMAAVSATPYSTFQKRLAPVTSIDDPDDYSDIELAWNDARPPRIPTPPEARGQSETYRRAVAVADFAALDETRWNVIRDFYEAERTQEELAKLYRIGQATISRYLDSITQIKKGLEMNTYESWLASQEEADKSGRNVGSGVTAACPDGGPQEEIADLSDKSDNQNEGDKNA